MKNHFFLALCIASCFVPIFKNRATTTVSFFIRPYPEIQTQESACIATKKIQTPGKLANYLMPSCETESLTAGIFSSYGGYLAVSDPDGQTTFPLGQEKPVVYYLITPQILPIIRFGNTLAHLELLPNIPAALYRVERKKDEDLNEHYWNVTRQDLPEDKKISRKAIIIFANPAKFFVPEGVTPTRDNPQLILPDIYVKKTIAKAHNALYVLTIRQFFSSLHKEYKSEPLSHIVQMPPWF